MTTKTYRAEFFTVADWAFRDFEAETPTQALELARQFHDAHLGDLDFRSYDAIEALDHLQIWDRERGALATWESEEYRLRQVAPEMLEALRYCDMTLADLEASKRKGYIAHAIELTRAALAKAKGEAT